MAWDALSMMSITAPEQISGLGNNEKDILVELFEIYNNHFSANKLKNKYYEGKVTLSDVNIGIAIPNGVKDIGIGCSWGAKTVDVLASRSMFDGFVGENGSNNELLNEIVVLSCSALSFAISSLLFLYFISVSL